jgi:putative heme-binding domain-containing protein
MLHPATQPGSKLDFEYPAETVTVVFRSDWAITLVAPSSKLDRISQNEVRLTVTGETNHWVPLELTLQTAPAPPGSSRERLGVRQSSGALDREPLSTSEQGTPKSKAPEDWRTPKLSGASAPALDVSWFTAEDPRPRALPLRRILLPWAKPAEAAPREETERTIPELAGGNWLEGQKVFFGEQAICSKCHFIRGRGTHVGPDLSNLVYRDYASVLKDIAEPSAAINPDHVAYTIELKDGGESLSGVPAGGDASKLLLADASGRITSLARSNIRSMQPSAKSLMPEGLLHALSAQQRKDLLTFLLVPEPLQPAPLEIAGSPPPRKRAEVETALGKTTRPAAEPAEQFQILLCAGPKDHGPGEHDYPLWQKRWSKLLALADRVSVDTAFDWPTPEQLRRANVVIFYSNNPGWSAARGPELDAVLNRGGGLVYIHYAVDGHDHCDELAQRIGLAWRGGASAFRHGPLDLKFAAHPITENLGPTQFVDESYWNLVGSEKDVQLLASGTEAGQARPLIWVRDQGSGRVFVSIPGHYTWTFDDPLFRLLLLRGIAWAGHQPLDRFNDLVTIGARLAD